MEATNAQASSSAEAQIPQMLCLSLDGSDRIRVMALSADSLPALRTAIEASWQYGIQSEGVYGISYEFKLRGQPWQGCGEQANDARRLIAGVFGFLLQQGWVLSVASDLSKLPDEKDTFYFKRETHPNPDAKLCAISFNMSDTIRVISGPPEVAQVVRGSIQDFWHRGLQRQGFYHGEPEFKLRGNPWTLGGIEAMQTRMFVGQMIEALDRAGWQVYASIDISTGRLSGNKDDHNYYFMDSWILRSRSSAPGIPAVGIPVQKEA